MELLKRVKPGQRVAVAMSGGGDSTSVALLLQENNIDIFGITMYLFDVPDERGQMGPPSFLQEARDTADRLGIDHHILDLREVFRRGIQTYFADEYLKGRTPNPCVKCNRIVKYGLLLKEAMDLGATYMATGHYANIRWDEELECCRVYSGQADRKDQAYVLHGLTQWQLQRILLPLGDIQNKEEVRDKVRGWRKEVGDKKDSFGVCFIPDGDYGRFIQSFTDQEPRPGNFVDQEGRVLGQHQGLVHYTIGQKRKLGIDLEEPLTVLSIDAPLNQIVLGPDRDCYASSLVAKKVNFIPFDTLTSMIQVDAKICVWGYRLPAILVPMKDGSVRVQFNEPVRAIAPGQSVVFYMGDEIIGGGIIE